MGEATMPITRLASENGSFSPDEVKLISQAFDQVLDALGLTDRSDPAVELVAMRMIALAKRGQLNVAELRDVTLKSIRQPSS
jgi:hypothetical protein